METRQAKIKPVPVIISRLFILAQLIAGCSTAQHPQPDTAGATVTDICDDARYARFAAMKLENAFNAAMQQANALQSASVSYKIAAAAAKDSMTAAALSVLSFVQSKQKADATRQLLEGKRKYDNAIRLLKLREGRLHNVIQTTFDGAVASEGKPIATGNHQNLASVVGCSATQTLKVKATSNCSLAPDDNGSVKYSQVDLNAATQLKHLTEESLKPQTITAMAYGMGAAGTAITAHTKLHGYCANDGTGNDLNDKTAVIGATITLNSRPSNTEQTPLYKTGTSGECKQKEISATWGEHKPRTLANALCEVRNQPLSIHQPLH
uniref:Variant surface glycoprotein 1125.5368 n=1 Tax=Trypanosoma brucei TaxID=5691 RepID=A0A1J0RC27_9TRYP|nr:variant surface glycoprotein 1125.5368 [Trypanosoma brucei]